MEWKRAKSHLNVPNNAIYHGYVDTNLNVGPINAIMELAHLVN